METVEYAPGRLVDLFGDLSRPTVLMWHGQQSNARAAMRPLAALVAEHGLAVVVPDWDSHGDDGGRGDLLASVQYVNEHVEPSDGVVLVGWSMGGLAAAGLTIHAREYGMELVHTVCLAGAFVVADPISGEHLEEALAGNPGRSPFTLLHGVADDVLPVEVSRSFGAVLERNDWPVDLVELAADHGSIAGATYDSAADRYAAATDTETLAVAADVGARIAGVARR
ncbi:MAG: alpha/beta fold hydrolase [Mycobacterium sp.]|uniref:alpha/beta hydrolase family protein n=1 Tax=Mycobacterium sp. TaxID=1785 RepID=UPI003CC6CDD4